ncbi:MAG: hypothetical protein ACK5P5_06550 [Pseudobdellovibrionaceae bacterium]
MVNHQQQDDHQFFVGQIISVDRTNERGKKILAGSFSSDLVAVPLASLNAGIAINAKQVTLQLQAYQKLSFFSFIFTLIKMIKRQDWILIYFPMLILLLKNSQNTAKIFVEVVLLAFIGLFFLILSLRIKNQVADHLSGIDRLNPDCFGEPLMTGKVKVSELNKAAYISLGLAAVYSMPLIIHAPLVLLFLLPSIALGLFVQFFSLSKFKSDKLGEFFLFCLFGPLYISGLDMIFIQQVTGETLFIGFYLGICSIFLLNLRVFSNFFFMAEVHSNNTLIEMGFDKAKGYLQFLMIFIVATFSFYQFVFTSLEYGLGSAILGLALALWLSRHLRSCDSPLSSKTKKMKQDLSQLVYSLHLIWIFIYLTKIFVDVVKEF